MTITLLISTYNSPNYLHLCLKSALCQTRLPDEIVIADDGSNIDTKTVIDSFRKQTSIPIIHVWHPDTGFKLSEIRNKAIACATGKYIIQIDGDIIMDKNFISDHQKVATPGCYVGASRTFLKEDYSKNIAETKHIDFKTIIHGCKNKFNALRVPFISPLFRYSKSHKLTVIRGCNMAYWKQDAIAINGYNEDIIGWGCEDCDFVIRLSNSGIKKKWIKFSAIAYHLYHRSNNSGGGKSLNYNIMQDSLNKKLTYIQNGISCHPKESISILQ